MTTPTDYSKMLHITYPGSQWTLHDIHNFDTLSWDDTNSAPQPSLSDIMAQLELVKAAEAMDTCPDDEGLDVGNRRSIELLIMYITMIECG